MSGLRLAAVIEALRAELTEAIDEGAGKGMQFQLDPIELTLQLVVTDEGNGKLGWKVLELGASRESVTTQTAILKLTPVWRMRDGTLVRDFAIASVQEEGTKFGPRQ